jgi:hypothetical protein
MLKNYHFQHNGHILVPIVAKSEHEARTALVIKHTWCNAPYNAQLDKITPLPKNSIYLQPQ